MAALPSTPMEEFNFYMKFAKPLVLNLPYPADRSRAAQWIKKLSKISTAAIKVKKLNSEGEEEQVEIAGDDKLRLRNDYLKLLLLVLQRKKMVGFFERAPKYDEELNEYPINLKYTDMAKQIAQNISTGEGGDVPPYGVEMSSDLKQYAVVQEIPNFGVHCYFAVSVAEPITAWTRSENAVFPKGMSTLSKARWNFPPLPDVKSSPKDAADAHAITKRAKLGASVRVSVMPEEREDNEARSIPMDSIVAELSGGETKKFDYTHDQKDEFDESLDWFEYYEQIADEPGAMAIDVPITTTEAERAAYRQEAKRQMELDRSQAGSLTPIPKGADDLTRMLIEARNSLGFSTTQPDISAIDLDASQGARGIQSSQDRIDRVIEDINRIERVLYTITEHSIEDLDSSYGPQRDIREIPGVPGTSRIATPKYRKKFRGPEVKGKSKRTGKKLALPEYWNPSSVHAQLEQQIDAEAARTIAEYEDESFHRQPGQSLEEYLEAGARREKKFADAVRRLHPSTAEDKNAEFSDDDYTVGMDVTPPIFRKGGPKRPRKYTAKEFGMTREQWEGGGWMDAEKYLNLDQRLVDILGPDERDMIEKMGRRFYDEEEEPPELYPDIHESLDESVFSIGSFEDNIWEKPWGEGLLVPDREYVPPTLEIKQSTKTKADYQRELDEYLQANMPPIDLLEPYDFVNQGDEPPDPFNSTEIDIEMQDQQALPLVPQRQTVEKPDLLELPYDLILYERCKQQDRDAENLPAHFMGGIEYGDVAAMLPEDLENIFSEPSAYLPPQPLTVPRPDFIEDVNIPRFDTSFLDISAIEPFLERPPPVRRHTMAAEFFDDFPPFPDRRSSLPATLPRDSIDYRREVVFQDPPARPHAPVLPQSDQLDDYQMEFDLIDTSYISEPPTREFIEWDADEIQSYRIPILEHITDPVRRFEIMKNYYRKHLREFPPARPPPVRRQSFGPEAGFAPRKPRRRSITDTEYRAMILRETRPPAPVVASDVPSERLAQLQIMRDQIASGENRKLHPLPPSLPVAPILDIPQPEVNPPEVQSAPYQSTENIKDSILELSGLSAFGDFQEFTGEDIDAWVRTNLPEPRELKRRPVKPSMRVPTIHVAPRVRMGEVDEDAEPTPSNLIKRALQKPLNIKIEGIVSGNKFVLTGGIQLGNNLYIYPNGIAVYTTNESYDPRPTLDKHVVESGEYIRFTGLALSGRINWFYYYEIPDEQLQFFDPRPTIYATAPPPLPPAPEEVPLAPFQQPLLPPPWRAPGMRPLPALPGAAEPADAPVQVQICGRFEGDLFVLEGGDLFDDGLYYYYYPNGTIIMVDYKEGRAILDKDLVESGNYVANVGIDRQGVIQWLGKFVLPDENGEPYDPRPTHTGLMEVIGTGAHVIPELLPPIVGPSLGIFPQTISDEIFEPFEQSDIFMEEPVDFEGHDVLEMSLDETALASRMDRMGHISEEVPDFFNVTPPAEIREAAATDAEYEAEMARMFQYDVDKQFRRFSISPTRIRRRRVFLPDLSPRPPKPVFQFREPAPGERTYDPERMAQYVREASAYHVPYYRMCPQKCGQPNCEH